MRNVIVYFVTKNGAFVERELLKAFLDYLEKKECRVLDIGMGSAYNMPLYLLGEMEEHFEEAMVVSFYESPEGLRPMIFIGEQEKRKLLEALTEVVDAPAAGSVSSAGADSSSRRRAKNAPNTWHILRRVHRELRSRGE